jgi:two-component sensor histidine kinase
LGGQSNEEAERHFKDVHGSARDARAAIFALDLGSDLAERAALVVTELATNAILHAGSTPNVRIWYGGGAVRLEVSDESETMPRAASAAAMSGRGLQIVTAMATAWGCQSQPGGKVVWAELD